MCIRAGQVGAVYDSDTGMITVGNGYEITEPLSSSYAINGKPFNPTVGDWWEEPNAMNDMTYNGTPVIKIFQEIIRKEFCHDELTVCTVKYNRCPYRVCVTAAFMVWGTPVERNCLIRLHNTGIIYEKEWPSDVNPPHVLFSL